MKKFLLGFLILILSFSFVFTSCYPQSTSSSNTRTTSTTSTKTQKLLVVVTDASGKTISSRTIDGNINDKSAIERFAKNIADNPGYSYLGGSWNEQNQFVGVVSSPAGRMLVAVRVAD
jgi:hypothetical protein